MGVSAGGQDVRGSWLVARDSERNNWVPDNGIPGSTLRFEGRVADRKANQKSNIKKQNDIRLQ